MAVIKNPADQLKPTPLNILRFLAENEHMAIAVWDSEHVIWRDIERNEYVEHSAVKVRLTWESTRKLIRDQWLEPLCRENEYDQWFRPTRLAIALIRALD
jgi:hypothetical protein